MPNPPVQSTTGSQAQFAKKSLSKVFSSLPDSLFVIDNQGNILLANDFTAVSLNMTLDQLLKCNVRDLVGKNYYDQSYALKALETKKVVSGIVTSTANMKMLNTATPIFDKKGNVDLVICTGRSMDLIKRFVPTEGQTAINRRKREIEHLRNEVLEPAAIVAESKSMQQLLHLAAAVAKTNSTILLSGETGVGKEVVAHYVHRQSLRANEAFIAVNCANLPENLVEAELFGYEKGAFTGANTEGKIGLFEAGHGGTIFLDEIAELPLPLQSKLLRVLETGEIRRVGGHFNRTIDFRLIAASHKNLKAMSEAGTFRKDLYYRLNVIPLHIPPLRERPEDLVALASTFLADFNKKYKAEASLDDATWESLKKYSWPGNIRELRNSIERKVINSLQIFPADSIIAAMTAADPASNNPFELYGITGSLKEVVQKAEEQYIRHTLQKCNGKIGETSNQLGIFRTVLYRKLKSFEKNHLAMEENDDE